MKTVALNSDFDFMNGGNEYLQPCVFTAVRDSLVHFLSNQYTHLTGIVSRVRMRVSFSLSSFLSLQW
jgi:hypothetical protein